MPSTEEVGLFCSLNKSGREGRNELTYETWACGKNVVVQLQADDGSVTQESQCHEKHRQLMTPQIGIYGMLWEQCN